MKDEGENSFVFVKNDNIGAAAAEHDQKFLADCFVDNGDIDTLIDCSDPKRILVGRTGAGKSALLAQVNDQCGNVIQLAPDSLSLNYIANSDLIAFFEESGLNLSVFYGLLWKHIIVVELLKAKFNIQSEASQKEYMARVKRMFERRDRLKEMAIDYFERFGNKFWLTTEQRMKELTQTVKNKLGSTIEGNSKYVNADASLARSFSEVEKKEVV